MTSPRFFATPAKFRAWLEKNHEHESELWVGYYRKDSGKPSITWPNSVDEALCFGWIDGVRKSVDDASYMIRFTPRKPNSIWSNVNIAKMEALIAEGRVAPAGLVAYGRRSDKRSGVYGYEQGEERDRNTAQFDNDAERTFKRRKAAWSYFQAQAQYYRKVSTHYVMSAKKAETRARRLASLIEHCAKGERML